MGSEMCIRDRVVDVAFSGELGVLFGEPWRAVPAAASPPEDEVRGEDVPLNTPSGKYEIDIDGRVSKDAS